jgi:hypothetical protein
MKTGNKTKHFFFIGLAPSFGFDKNSLLNGVKISKEGVVCQEEKFTRYGGFSQTVMGIPGQRAFGVRSGGPKTGPSSPTANKRGFFTHSCGQANPLPYPSEKDSTVRSAQTGICTPVRWGRLSYSSWNSAGHTPVFQTPLFGLSRQEPGLDFFVQSSASRSLMILF